MNTIRINSYGADVTAAEKYLAALGFYKGPIDTRFGSKLDAAVKKYQTAVGLKSDGIVGPLTWAKLLPADTLPIPTTESNVIAFARTFLGRHEIKGTSTPDDEWIRGLFDYTSYGHGESSRVAWCAAFVCMVLQLCGYAHSHSAAAKSLAYIGEACGKEVGAVAVIRHTKGTLAGHYHVTFIESFDEGGINGLGGNQANAVTIERFANSEIYAIRRPLKVA